MNTRNFRLSKERMIRLFQRRSWCWQRSDDEETTWISSSDMGARLSSCYNNIVGYSRLRLGRGMDELGDDFSGEFVTCPELMQCG